MSDAAPTIHVHLGKPCWICGKQGATGKDAAGGCMKCMVKLLNLGWKPPADPAPFIATLRERRQP